MNTIRFVTDIYIYNKHTNWVVFTLHEVVLWVLLLSPSSQVNPPPAFIVIISTTSAHTHYLRTLGNFLKPRRRQTPHSRTIQLPAKCHENFFLHFPPPPAGKLKYHFTFGHCRASSFSFPFACTFTKEPLLLIKSWTTLINNIKLCNLTSQLKLAYREANYLFNLICFFFFLAKCDNNW